MKFTYILFSISLLFGSCKKQHTVAYQAMDTVENAQTTSQAGKKLMEQQCYTCHSPSASMQERLAPPMIAVKKHYLSEEISKEAFTKAIWNWVENPSEEKTKMRGAVRRFGIMPYQEFKKEDIEAIANYMFDNNIEQPEWFEDHFKEMKGKQ